MRHLIIVIAAAGIMVLGFVASLTMLGDESRLKQLLISHVEMQTGRQLAIDGTVSVRLFPRLRIEARDIRLSGPDAVSGPDFLTSETLSAEIRLLPLMTGRVETRDVALQGARLKLMVDESGRHSLGGLVRRPGRQRSPGIVPRGPLRLEDIEIDIGSMDFGVSQQLAVDEVLLDGLAFDRLLEMSFRGAIGRPPIIEGVTVNGLLFVPAGPGDFRLIDMKMTGRFAGAEKFFDVLGALSFSAVPPLSMKLDEGRMAFDGQQLLVQGSYESRERPYLSASLVGQAVDGPGLLSLFGSGLGADLLAETAGWVAANDFDLEFVASSLVLPGYRFSSPRVRLKATGGVARIVSAQAGLPGAVLDLEAELKVDRDEPTLWALARLEVDDLKALLASTSSGLDMEGAGRIEIRPNPIGDNDALAGLTVTVFDGRLAGFDRLLEAVGLKAVDRFDALEAQVLVYPDLFVFPVLTILSEGAVVRMEGLVIRDSRLLSGRVEVSLATGESVYFELSGRSTAPEFLALPGDASGQ